MSLRSPALAFCIFLSHAAQRGLCATCLPGTSVQAPGTCADCPAHTYSLLSNQSSCTPCIENYFLPHTRSTENLCRPCPANEVSASGQACLCPTPDHYTSPTTGACERWGTECNYRRQYRSYYSSTGACLNARTRCREGQSDPGNCCALGLRSRHTHTTDATCFSDPSLDGLSCNPETHYTIQGWVWDADGVVIRPLECRRLDTCAADQFELSPSGPRENRVCIFVTRCDPRAEFIAQNATRTSDTVCAPRTRCRFADGEVLLRMGGPFHDDACAVRVRCDGAAPRTFLEQPPSNATSPAVHGSAGGCRAVTACPPGSSTSSDPLHLRDDLCSVCPAGTASADGRACIPCPLGLRFSGAANQTRCLECTSCATASIASGPLSCPPGESCTMATLHACSSTHDTVCMQCPRQWFLTPGAQLCRPCAAGHFLLPSSPTQYEAHRCTPCPANTFCESTAAYSACPGLRSYSLSGAHVFVPSSPTASSRVDACTCHLAGGFQGVGGSLLGCTACPDGTFSAPGDTRCQDCPVGSFSRAASLPELYRCGAMQDRALVFGPDGIRIPPPDPHAQGCMVTVGATSCTLCPRNSTRSPRAQSPSDCTMCRDGSYLDAATASCKPCSPPCQRPGSFETSPCTDTSDRRCQPCNLSCTLPGQYTQGCPGSALPLQPSLGCGLCTNLPARNAAFLPSHGVAVHSPLQCPWSCDAGFYSPAGLNACLPCTHFDLSSCPAGTVLSPCTSERDASCLVPCTNSTKPPRHSAYIPTARGQDGQAIPAPAGSAQPNRGCLWACEQGYRLHTTAAGLHACVSA